MSEIYRGEMRLSEKQTVEFAKFCDFIDTQPDDLFDKTFFNKKNLTNLVFEVLNNNPNHEMSWVIDQTFDQIARHISRAEMRDLIPKLGHLRLILSQSSSNHFETGNHLYGAPSVIDEKTTSDDAMTLPTINDDDTSINEPGGLWQRLNTKKEKTGAEEKETEHSGATLEGKPEYLSPLVDRFLDKIPEVYFGINNSSKESIASYLKVCFASLKKLDITPEILKELKHKIFNDITCPNGNVLYQMIEIWITAGDLSDDPIFTHTPMGEKIKKLSLDQNQLVTFANFCDFIERIDFSKSLVSKKELIDMFYENIKHRATTSPSDIVEIIGLALYHKASDNAARLYKRDLSPEDIGNFNEIYFILKKAAETNFSTESGSHFLEKSSTKPTTLADALDDYETPTTTLKIADETSTLGITPNKNDKDDETIN